jgi:hypothetical protein
VCGIRGSPCLTTVTAEGKIAYLVIYTSPVNLCGVDRRPHSTTPLCKHADNHIHIVTLSLIKGLLKICCSGP